MSLCMRIPQISREMFSYTRDKRNVCQSNVYVGVFVLGNDQSPTSSMHVNESITALAWTERPHRTRRLRDRPERSKKRERCQMKSAGRWCVHNSKFWYFPYIISIENKK